MWGLTWSCDSLKALVFAVCAVYAATSRESYLPRPELALAYGLQARNGFVGENETQIAVRAGSPVRHRRGRNLAAFEQQLRRLGWLQTQLTGIDEHRPAAMRTDHRQVSKRAHQEVATALPLRDRSCHAVVGCRQRGSGAGHRD